MSRIIIRSKYKKMLTRRTKLIQKKIQEIEDIKITYGTNPHRDHTFPIAPSMTGTKEMKHQLALWKSDLED